MRYSFISKDTWEPGCGKLVEDETGDLINYGAAYRVECEREELEQTVTRLQAELAQERSRRVAAETIVDAVADRIPNQPDTFYNAVTRTQAYRAKYLKDPA